MPLKPVVMEIGGESGTVLERPYIHPSGQGGCERQTEMFRFWYFTYLNMVF